MLPNGQHYASKFSRQHYAFTIAFKTSRRAQQAEITNNCFDLALRFTELRTTWSRYPPATPSSTTKIAGRSGLRCADQECCGRSHGRQATSQAGKETTPK